MRTSRCILLILLILTNPDSASGVDSTTGLSVETSASGKSYLAYGGEPLFAFGPGDEMRLLSGAADVGPWASWQNANGMNLLRAYPASVPVGNYGTAGLHPFQQRGDKWDVDSFNDAYFAHLGDVAAELESYGIILHLQLWQIVFFKGGRDRWDANYLNPANNVNEWTRSLSRGRDYIDAPADSPARRHQREWVMRLLDAIKDRNNVWLDVINELGNEMGSLEWSAEVVSWIREWEEANNRNWIVGVDSEHHYRQEVFSPYRDVFDIIILNELRSPGHARQAIRSFGMPAVSVRSSDGRNRWEDYLFARPDQTDPEHQTRYRTLCYRSLFAGLQGVGAYWKPEIHEADYRAMEYWAHYARALRGFWEHIADEWPHLEPDDTIVVGGAITPHAHGLRSGSLLALYLECGSHTWNNSYPESRIVLTCSFPSYRVEVFHPKTGEFGEAGSSSEGETLRLSLPAFVDDLVVLVWNED